MRRGRTLILVLLIIIIGLVVGFVAIRQFLATPAPEQPLFVEVFIAGQNIAQGGKITEDLLTTMTIPQDKVITVMYVRDEMSTLVGKVAKFPLDQGVVITESMVNDGSSAIPISGPQWASLIPAGQTAISIPADRLSLAGYAVNNGAHVNINACFLFVDIDPAFQSALPNQTALLTGTGFTAEGLPVLSLGVAAGGSSQGRLELDPSLQQPYYLIPSERQRPRMVCQMLLQDVVVMRVGDFPLDPTTNLAMPVVAVATAAPADGQQAAPAPTGPDIVTLLVSPQDSITLSYLILTDAELSLTLRNPSDQARQATEASTLQFLLSQYNIPVPAKLPYSLEPYTISFGNLTLGSPEDVVVPAQ
jgi:pilus assembly protein CpaB